MRVWESNGNRNNQNGTPWEWELTAWEWTGKYWNVKVISRLSLLRMGRSFTQFNCASVIPQYYCRTSSDSRLGGGWRLPQCQVPATRRATNKMADATTSGRNLSIKYPTIAMLYGYTYTILAIRLYDPIRSYGRSPPTTTDDERTIRRYL